MGKRILFTVLSGILGLILGVVLTYGLFIPAGFYLFGAPTTSPNGMPLPACILVQNNTGGPVEFYLDEKLMAVIQPDSNQTSERLEPGKHRLWYKTENGEVVVIGTVDLPPDRMALFNLMPQGEFRWITARWDFFFDPSAMRFLGYPLTS
ncbi:MAG: hypothetical protein ACPLPW_08575 [bacterium]|jgi:hypothetical protein|nr:hypothetical protein [Caldisericota bacterium]